MSLAKIFHKTVKIEPLFVLLNDAGGSLCPQDIWFYCLKFCLPGSGRTSFSYIMVPTNIYIFFSWNIAVLGREISTTYIIFDNPFSPDDLTSSMQKRAREFICINNKS